MVKHHFCLLLIAFVAFGCSNKEKQKGSTGLEKSGIEAIEEDSTSGNEFTEDKKYLKPFYEMPHIKSFYEGYQRPRKLEVPDDLSNLSYGDLRLLRNEIFARNGYLFSDGFLRGYFNQFKWYQPIFDVENFKVHLNNQEEELLKSIVKEEEKRKEQLFTDQKGIELYNSDLLANTRQFSEIPEEVQADLASNNFSIVHTKRPMPFYVYDKNAYQYIPHFITTDLYLYILHKYFSVFLEEIDQKYMSVQLLALMKDLSNKLEDVDTETEIEKKSVDWAKAFAMISLSAMDEKITPDDSRFYFEIKSEMEHIKSESGKPAFIENRFLTYDNLTPRGHYTKSDELKKYFKGFKWLSMNGVDVDDEDQLRGMITLAWIINKDPMLYKQYTEFVNIYTKVAGEEDNYSLTDLMKIVTTKELSKSLEESNLKSIRLKLRLINKNRINPVFGENFNTEEKNKTRLYFFSSTYSISGELFSKLVHIDDVNSKRPFPGALDVPAVFGNKTAKHILFEEHETAKKWPEYEVRFNKLQNQFKSFADWGQCYAFMALNSAFAASAELDSYPGFMKTDAYNRKELNTTLSSWTHVKHDLLLYQEKPYAAECGQGGGPKPPKHFSYVEPNIEFWSSAMDLVGWLEDLVVFKSSFKPELRKIKELGKILKTIAEKELQGKIISDKEYDELHYVGGTIEYILLGLLETDHIPDREKSMGIIADVYSYNGVNLNVAVGHADDIYVVVPIEGEYNIARGSVFSFYEFTGKITTDEQWRQSIDSKTIEDRPDWIRPLIRKDAEIKGQMQYRYVGHGY